MKKIVWQHKNEKILYFSRESLISYTSRNFNFLYIIVWILVFIIFFSYFFELSQNIFFLIISIYIIISWILFLFFWYKTFFISTNKRVIKYIRNWILSQHSKELKIDQINELTVSKVWIMANIFWFWNIKITGKDKETVIRIKWISYPYEVIQYISRIRDYCIENPWYDYNEINSFKLRKERQKNKEK